MNGHRLYNSASPAALSSSNLLLFIRFRTLAQWSLLNSILINYIRTLAHPTEGEGVFNDPSARRLPLLPLCKFAPLLSTTCKMLLPQPLFFQAFALLPGGGMGPASVHVHSPFCPFHAGAQVLARLSVLMDARRRTVQAIVQWDGAVYLTIQLQRTARQYAWHAEPGSPAGVPYAGQRAAQRGKPLQERPLS